MWLLHYLPESIFSFVVHGLLVLGVVGTFLSFFVINKILSKIPGFAKYYKIAQVSSITALTVGVYLWGAYGMEMAYRDRIAELEKEIAEAKEKSAQLNSVIENKVTTKTVYVKEKGETIVQQVDKVITVEKDCAIPKEAIDVHNDAARMNKAIEELRQGAKK